ncbi:hypothetical protein D3C72_1987630 [compost metagenome]
MAALKGLTVLPPMSWVRYWPSATRGRTVKAALPLVAVVARPAQPASSTAPRAREK